MASIISLSINLDKIDKSKIIEGKKGRYLDVTLSVKDDSKYGQNVSVMMGQSKEEREAKQPKQYIGNGKVIWTDGLVMLAERDDSGSGDTQADDLYSEPTPGKLPF